MIDLVSYILFFFQFTQPFFLQVKHHVSTFRGHLRDEAAKFVNYFYRLDQIDEEQLPTAAHDRKLNKAIDELIGTSREPESLRLVFSPRSSTSRKPKIYT